MFDLTTQFRRRTRLAVLLGVTGLIAWSGPLRAENRTAILIGIDTYNPKNPPPRTSPASTVKRPPARGNWSAWYYPDLNGAVNDVNLMNGILSTPSLGFKDITVLRNEQATADAILTTLNRKLLVDARKDDLVFVYYSGHGGTVRNEGSTERYKLDQTIVPADHFRGDVPDIRDKELSRILWKAGKNGVKVIFVADSCHSGGLSRGAWNERGLTRTARSSPSPDAKPYPVQINDPADKDPDSKKDINPVDAGVIMIAAAQEDESAEEDPNTPQGQQGAFTWALKRALEQGLEQPMDVVIRRASSLLKSDNFAQAPDLHGNETHSITLFGLKPAAVSSTTAIVQSVDPQDCTILVRGGKALGIYEGAQLKRILSSAGPMEIQIAQSIDLVRSYAKRIESGASCEGIKPNDIFEVDKWVIPDDPMLKVFVPPAGSADNVFQTATEVGKLRADKSVHWLNDISEATAGQVMYWNGSEWVMEKNPATGQPVKLGVNPTQDDVRKHLDLQQSFFLLLPPTATLVENLKLDVTDEPGRPSSIDVLKKAGGDHYRLMGRLNESTVEYAWIQPDATEDSVRKMAADKNAAERLPLPLRTDWIALGGLPESAARAGSDLNDKALRLGRLRSWLTLLSPPGAAATPFPYHLAFREVGQTGFVTNNETHGGHRYKMYLRASADDLRLGVPDRFVYIFSIDHYGRGTLLFPQLGEGNAGNRFPKRVNGNVETPADLPVMDGAYDFEVGKPFGVDTFMMLVSKEPIEDTQIFEFDGVRTKGATRGMASRDPLTLLLSEIGTRGSRGLERNPAVPVTWSIEEVPILSKEN